MFKVGDVVRIRSDVTNEQIISIGFDRYFAECMRNREYTVIGVFKGFRWFVGTGMHLRGIEMSSDYEFKACYFELVRRKEETNNEGV